MNGEPHQKKIVKEVRIGITEDGDFVVRSEPKCAPHEVAAIVYRTLGLLMETVIAQGAQGTTPVPQKRNLIVPPYSFHPRKTGGRG